VSPSQCYLCHILILHRARYGVMLLSVKFKDRCEVDGNVEGSGRNILNSLLFYSHANTRNRSKFQNIRTEL